MRIAASAGAVDNMNEPSDGMLFETAESPGETQFESARDAFLTLLRWYRNNTGNRNEATTRLHLIDTVLFECLAWNKLLDCSVETPHGNEYADYVLSCPLPSVVLEAKREGIWFEIPVAKQRRFYSLRSLCRECSNLRSAIEQAARYAQSRGIPLAIVSNGHQFLAFIASRDDGRPPLEGKAVVFESMQAIANDFIRFWNLLSKPGIQDRRIISALLGDFAPPRPPKLSARVHPYPGIQRRNFLQTDLQNLAGLILHDLPLSDDLDEEFMKHCYCPSDALSQHALVSKRFLESRYVALFEHAPEAPITQPTRTRKGMKTNLLAEAIFKRPILILGDVGVGKTTFFRCLITRDAAVVLGNAIVLYIDFGSQAALTKDIRDFVSEEIALQLYRKYDIDIDDAQFVRGVYHLELKRMEKSIIGRLKTEDPKAYHRKEIEKLVELASDREKHLIGALTHITRARLRQVVVILDNVDQRTDDIQQQTFTIGHGIAAGWPAAVFIALRPETFHRSRQQGVLSAYHTKAFTIAPPRIDYVINRRLRFGEAICAGDIPIAVLQQSNRDSVQNVEKVICVLRKSFERNCDLVECIDNMCGGNVRLALDMVAQFIGCGHVDTRKIIDIVTRKRRYTVPLHELIRSIVYGESLHFDPRASVAVCNVFDVISADPASHFLILHLLNYLKEDGATGSNYGFVKLDSAVAYAQSLGFTTSIITWAVGQMQARGLIDTSGRSELSRSEDGVSARITTRGAYHLQKLSKMFTYVDAMILDCSILDESFSGRIDCDATGIRARLDRCATFVEYLDWAWSMHKGETAPRLDWAEIAIAIRDDVESIQQGLGVSEQRRHSAQKFPD